jgi:tetratricopeptide (TPR) repeat protein
MLFVFSNLAVMVIAAVVFWPLSGFDSRLTGHDREDFARRAVRCGVTLLIVEAGFYALWRCWIVGDRSAGFMYLTMLVPLALLWTGCISEAGAECFHRLIDPQDKRPYDPKAATRELDAIGGLIRSGQKEEAIQLCKTLLQTSPELQTAIEMTLHHLGAPPPESTAESKPLAEAGQLRQAGKFEDAEAVLTSLLKREPSRVDAALMLIRLYGQEMRQPDKAAIALRTLEKKPHVPAAYIEIARRSIVDRQTRAAPSGTADPEEPMPQSIEELIAKKYLGTAIDALERQCEDEPGNFEAWLKLAEVHGVHCANVQLAEKTIRRMEASPALNAEQKQQARIQLNEWREEKNHPLTGLKA